MVIGRTPVLRGWSCPELTESWTNALSPFAIFMRGARHCQGASGPGDLSTPIVWPGVSGKKPSGLSIHSSLQGWMHSQSLPILQRMEGHISTEGLFAVFRGDMDAFHFPFPGGVGRSGWFAFWQRKLSWKLRWKLRPGAKTKRAKGSV